MLKTIIRKRNCDKKMSYWHGRGYGRGVGRNRGGGWDRGLRSDKWGQGNRYPYCRWNPNLPRGWWPYLPEILQQWGIDASQFPYSPGTELRSTGYPSRCYEIPGYPTVTPNQENQILKSNIIQLETELAVTRERMAELEPELKKGVK
ncbi:MAG: hypothetical protein ACFFCQ_15030 [Promethearchaeota archaeon]